MDIRLFDIPRYLSALPLFQESTPQDLARLASGDWIIVNGNDGVDDGANSGETQLIRLGPLSGN